LIKKWQATYITLPLNHVPPYVPILGESAGAGRVGLAGAKILFYILQTLCALKITLYIGSIQNLNHEKL
jgi:hypothetical protein